MKLVIVIDLDNDAFDGSAGLEVERILTKWGRRASACLAKAEGQICHPFLMGSSLGAVIGASGTIFKPELPISVKHVAQSAFHPLLRHF